MSLLLLLLGSAVGPLLFAQSKSVSSSAAPNVSADEALRGQKLILKDGTDQIVREYQLIGDRVRYYSVERSEWEEIPASMVDWDATRKAAGQSQQQAKQAIALAHRVDLEEHPGSLDVDAGLGLPPGVLLPPGDGIYAFDGRAILRVHQDLAKDKLDKGHLIEKLVVPLPIVSTRYNVFLDGKKAQTRIANSEPIFYYRTTSAIPPQFRLIRTKVKGNRREIEFLDSYFGQKNTQANEIPLNLQPINNDTYRLMASQDLSTGEYVLAQVDSGKGIDLYVWDFGIDPSPKPSAKKKK